MKLLKLTAIQIAENYPQNTIIMTDKGDSGKYRGIILLKKRTKDLVIIHNTSHSYNSEESARLALVKICEACVKHLKPKK